MTFLLFLLSLLPGAAKAPNATPAGEPPPPILEDIYP